MSLWLSVLISPKQSSIGCKGVAVSGQTHSGLVAGKAKSDRFFGGAAGLMVLVAGAANLFNQAEVPS